jgi:hypothetical protein
MADQTVEFGNAKPQRLGVVVGLPIGHAAQFEGHCLNFHGSSLSSVLRPFDRPVNRISGGSIA